MALTCLATMLIGFSYPMSLSDISVINSTIHYCSKNYLDMPCLITLEKRSETTFRATCGSKREKK